MAKKSYSVEERQQIRQALLETGHQLFSQQGCRHTTLPQVYEQVGISKTFFYSFFSSKEEFIEQVLYYQQPKLLAYAGTLMENPKLTWREAVTKFLQDSCYGHHHAIMIMSIEEEQDVYQTFDQERFQQFQKRQVDFFSQLLCVLKMPPDTVEPRFFGNLVLSLIMVRKAIPETMPFLFSEVADEVAAFQINVVVDYMEQIREQTR